VAQNVPARVEQNMEDQQVGSAQPGKYLGKVIPAQDGLRGDQMLAGLTGQLGGGRHDQRPPRRPMLEIGHRMIVEIRPQHVTHGLWIEQPGTRSQRQQFRRVAVLPAPKVPFSQMITRSCHGRASYAANSWGGTA
jgi:hypothetical protein